MIVLKNAKNSQFVSNDCEKIHIYNCTIVTTFADIIFLTIFGHFLKVSPMVVTLLHYIRAQISQALVIFYELLVMFVTQFAKNFNNFVTIFTDNLS